MVARSGLQRRHGGPVLPLLIELLDLGMPEQFGARFAPSSSFISSLVSSTGGNGSWTVPLKPHASLFHPFVASHIQALSSKL